MRERGEEEEEGEMGRKDKCKEDGEAAGGEDGWRQDGEFKREVNITQHPASIGEPAVLGREMRKNGLNRVVLERLGEAGCSALPLLGRMLRMVRCSGCSGCSTAASQHGMAGRGSTVGGHRGPHGPVLLGYSVGRRPPSAPRTAAGPRPTLGAEGGHGARPLG